MIPINHHLDDRLVPLCLTVFLILSQILARARWGHYREAHAKVSRARFGRNDKVHYAFRAAQAMICATLVAISGWQAGQCIWTNVASNRLPLASSIARCPESCLVVSYVYAACCLVGAIVYASSNCWRGTIVLLASLAAYTHRDLWPFATYNSTPLDLAEGKVLWIKITALVASSCVLPLFMPSRYVASNPLKNDIERISPRLTASWASQLTHTYFDYLFFSKERNPFSRPDFIPPLSDADRSAALRTRTFKDLDRWSGASDRHLFLKLVYVFRRELSTMTITVACVSLLGIASPLGINQILNYLETGSTKYDIRPWFWIMWIFLGPSLQTLGVEWYLFMFGRNIVRQESLMIQLIYERILRMRRTSRATTTQKGPSKQDNKNSDFGRLNNLITVDMSSALDSADFIWALICSPLQLVVYVAFLYNVLGKSAFIGVGILIVLSPIPMKITKATRDLHVRRLKCTDARAQDLTEATNLLRMIKLFAWEQLIARRIGEKRKVELDWLFKRKVFDVAILEFSFFIPTLSMLGTYATSTILLKEALNPAKVFSSTAVFFMISELLRVTAQQSVKFIQSKVSFDRMNHFLNSQDDLLDEYADKGAWNLSQPHEYLGFKDCEFHWDSVGDQPGHLSAPVLQFKDEVRFEKQGVNLIIGPTGCGKTAALMALLGEIPFKPTSPDSWFSSLHGQMVGYVAQEVWIENHTLRDNIIFNSDYDEERYRQVIRQCALERDLVSLEAGDQTEIGEKGVTLSGGQKARVALARAIYSKADILILDDVFSALDVQTSTRIMQQCICGPLANTRTIIIATHSVELLSPIADFILELNNDGTVASQTRSTSAKGHRTTITQEILSSDANRAATPGNHVVKSSQGMILPEVALEGRMAWRPLVLLVESLGGSHPVAFLGAWVAGLALYQGLGSFQVWFLGHWGTESSRARSTNVDIRYASIYAAIMLCMLGLHFATNTFYAFGTIRASRVIHFKLLQSVLACQWRWLDQTPVSRIVSRFTRDINTVDVEIYDSLSFLVDLTIRMVIRLGVIVSVTPVFLLPGLLVGSLGLTLGHFYLKTQLAVKRLVSNVRVPVMSHLNNTAEGLASIRAFNSQDVFRKHLLQRLDDYQTINFIYYTLNRWLAIRIDFLSSLFTASLTTYLVYIRPTSALNAGLSLDMALSLSWCLLWFVRRYNKLELQSNSLERIQSYLDIDHEPQDVPERSPPAAWPTSGELRVENLEAAYSETGKLVLKGISAHIRSGERIGIVGRTGSGKSSLVLSLLRCIHTNGNVFYDGLSTNNINLSALRANIAVIPQMPELLAGSLRDNIDPDRNYEDVALYNALRETGLASFSNGELDLDSMLAAGGSNLSLGQRQIIALVRAALRGTKVIILDEATSSIDDATDALIQEMLRNTLSKDTTVIVIAHRLKTVLDLDRILVLDAGRVVEFDTPNVLLSRKGTLSALVECSMTTGIPNEGSLDKVFS